MIETGYPPRQGLYDPQNEKDACGFGFVVDIQGRATHDIVEQALTVLVNLEHRGAAGAEANTGDGAGILLQTPHAFLKAEAARLGVTLPAPGAYAVGMVFLPPNQEGLRACAGIFEDVVLAEGQRVLGWREVPTDNATLGPTARASQPVIRQILIGRGPDCADEAAFERKLYVIRRLVEKRVSRSAIPGRTHFYVPSLSHKTVVYKGMLNAGQLRELYLDLSNPAVVSALAMVHSRFSTNTFPSWSRAHPYRYISHNGEINTLRGNINWIHARQSMMRSSLLGDDLQKVLTVVDTEGSDSAMFDNVLELLTLSGRELPHAMMMMVPEPWVRHEAMSPEKRAFYEFHSCLMEPWDGPASIAFTDGVRVGAVLDRNGLRPSRYYVTKDDLVVMASEVGVLDIPPERILEKGRLQPGRMFLVDTKERRIVSDEELKERIAREKPYGEWLERFSGYSDKPVSQALCYLYETGRVVRVADGWLLVENASTDDEEPPAGMDDEADTCILEPAPEPVRGATARRPGRPRGAKYPASRNFSDSALISISNSLNLKELKDFKDFKNNINTNTIKTPGKKRKITNKYRDQLWEELRRLNLRHNKRTEALVEMDHITPEYLRGMGEKLEREGRGGPRNTGLLVCALESGEPVTHAEESVHETVEKFLGRKVNSINIVGGGADKADVAAADYRAGKAAALSFFVGQVMKATRGQANPAAVNEILQHQT